MSDAMISSVSQKLTELKKAYSVALREKEEQIFFLKQELVDLKTLVKVLEEENDRLSRKIK